MSGFSNLVTKSIFYSGNNKNSKYQILKEKYVIKEKIFTGLDISYVGA